MTAAFAVIMASAYVVCQLPRAPKSSKASSYNQKVFQGPAKHLQCAFMSQELQHVQGQ